MSDTKHCPRCKTQLPATLEFFPRSKQTPTGLAGFCRKCQTTVNADWARRNQEKVRASKRKNYALNREKERIRHKAAREANPEKHRAKVRQSYYKHRDVRLARRAEYHARNLEKERAYGREYRKKNQFSLTSKESKARARARKAGVIFEVVDYAAILAAHGSVCHICRGSIDLSSLVFDHVIPITKGGPHQAHNILPAHYNCNRLKKNKLID